jgi:hypothetical protein
VEYIEIRETEKLQSKNLRRGKVRKLEVNAKLILKYVLNN